jgi:hypothetical protein
LILLAFAGGAVLFMPIGGAVAPRWAPTGVTTSRAAFAFTLSLVLPLLASDALALAVATFGMGAANGLLDVSMNAHASVVERRWSAPIMSSFHAAFSIGGLTGAGVGAAFLYFGASAPSLLAAVGVVGFAAVALASRALGSGERRNASGYPLAWPAPAFFALATIAFLLFLAEGAIIDWSGVYLASIGASAAFASAGFATFSIAIVTGRLLGDRVVARYGRMFVVSTGALVAAAGFALAAGSLHIASLLVAYAMVGAGPCERRAGVVQRQRGFRLLAGSGHRDGRYRWLRRIAHRAALRRRDRRVGGPSIGLRGAGGDGLRGGADFDFRDLFRMRRPRLSTPHSRDRPWPY